MKKKNTVVLMTTPEQDRSALRLLVRARMDFQDMRKRMDNRIGKKADGTDQELTETRDISSGDAEMFLEISRASRDQEEAIEKILEQMLKRFAVYNSFLNGVKGVGTIASATIISAFDIEKATTVSKMWQYAGLNPGMVEGKVREEREDGGFDLIPSGKMIRGDKMTKGFIAPYNKILRVALCGVLAEGFVKAQSSYALEYYYPYKERLTNSEQETQETLKGGKVEQIKWKEARKGHIHSAAKRYMIKMFLRDLYVAWRSVEGLPVRESYQEQYLGHKHG